MKLLLLYKDYSVHIERFKNAFASNGYEIDTAKITSFAEIPETTSQYDVCIICPIFVIPEEILAQLPERRIYISMAFDITHDYPALPKVERELVKKQIENSSGIICDSIFIKEKVLELARYAIPSIVLPYGIDLQLFSHFEIDKYNPVANINIAAIRNWHGVHNQSSILNAIERIESKGTNLNKIRFHIAGDGPYRKIEEERISKYIEKGLVIDHGKISNKDIMNIIQFCDIYLSSSTTDGASVSLLEAMFSGCIPVVSDIPGNLPWITNEKNGFLFNENPADQLLKVIGMLSDVSHKEFFAEMRAYNRLKIHREADWEKNSLELVNFTVGKLDA